ncbi:hypothetical protein HK098_001873 [Nowakowskiella sp. JEL0407]|nr:hypothetical protein HK098_001873 [Nowakowskiella sp. JEL0407]
MSNFPHGTGYSPQNQRTSQYFHQGPRPDYYQYALPQQPLPQTPTVYNPPPQQNMNPQYNLPNVNPKYNSPPPVYSYPPMNSYSTSSFNLNLPRRITSFEKELRTNFTNIAKRLREHMANANLNANKNRVNTILNKGSVRIEVSKTWEQCDVSDWNLTFDFSTFIQDSCSLSICRIDEDVKSIKQTIFADFDSFCKYVFRDGVEIFRNTSELNESNDKIVRNSCNMAFLKEQMEYGALFVLNNTTEPDSALLLFYLTGFPVVRFSHLLGNLQKTIRTVKWNRIEPHPAIPSNVATQSSPQPPQPTNEISPSTSVLDGMSVLPAPNRNRVSFIPPRRVLPPGISTATSKPIESPPSSSESSSSRELNLIKSSLDANNEADLLKRASLSVELIIRSLTPDATRTLLNSDVKFANDVLSRTGSRSVYKTRPMTSDGIVECGYFKFHSDPRWFNSELPQDLENIGLRVIMPSKSSPSIIIFFPPRPATVNNQTWIEAFADSAQKHFSLLSEPAKQDVNLTDFSVITSYSQQRFVIQTTRRTEYRIYTAVNIPLGSVTVSQLILGMTSDLKGGTKLLQSINELIRTASKVPTVNLVIPGMVDFDSPVSQNIRSPVENGGDTSVENLGFELAPVRPRAIADLFGLRRYYGRLEGVYIGSTVRSRIPNSSVTSLIPNLNPHASNAAPSFAKNSLDLISNRRALGIANDPFENPWIRLILIFTNDGYVIDGTIPKSGALSRFFMDGSDSHSNGAGGAMALAWSPDQDVVGSYRLSIDGEKEKVLIHWKAPPKTPAESQRLESDIQGIPDKACRKPGTKTSEARIIDDDTLVFDSSQFMTLNDLRIQRVTGFPLLPENLQEIQNIKDLEPQAQFRPLLADQLDTKLDIPHLLEGRYVVVNESSTLDQFIQFNPDGHLLVFDPKILSKFDEKIRPLSASGTWRFRAWHFTLDIFSIDGTRIEFSVVPVPNVVDFVVDEPNVEEPLREVYIDGVLYRRMD